MTEVPSREACRWFFGEIQGDSLRTRIAWRAHERKASSGEVRHRSYIPFVSC